MRLAEMQKTTIDACQMTNPSCDLPLWAAYFAWKDSRQEKSDYAMAQLTMYVSAIFRALGGKPKAKSIGDFLIRFGESPEKEADDLGDDYLTGGEGIDVEPGRFRELPEEWKEKTEAAKADWMAAVGSFIVKRVEPPGKGTDNGDRS